MSNSQYAPVPRDDQHASATGRTPPPSYNDQADEKFQVGSSSNSLKMGSAPKQEEQSSRLLVTASVSFYLVAALVMIMVNKWVLLAVPVPLFFLLIQLLTAVILLHFTSLFGLFKIPELRLSVCKGLTPLIAINCVGLAFNTYCLQYVDASFYQIARGLVLPFTTLLSYIVLKQGQSKPLLLAIGIVCLGFMAGVSTENLSVSGIGIILGVLSSATTAGHAIVVKRSLPIVNGSAMDLAYYSNFLSAFIMAPAAILAETGSILQMFAVGGKPLQTFWIGGLVTGVFGFLICIAGFISIKVTSPVTHMVSSAVRGVIQTVLGVWLFHDIVTSGRLSGIALILGGSILYTYLKDREMRVREQMQKNSYALAERDDGPSDTVFDMEDEARREEDRALMEADELIRQDEEAEKRREKA